MGENYFCNANCDAVGCKPVKLMVSLKHLAFVAATLAWQDYFQMGSTTSRKAVEELYFTVSTSNTLQGIFLHPLLHLEMLGSLDCMHV